MKIIRALITLAVAVIPSVAAAAELTGDHIATDRGDLIIHPILHATFAVQWNGKTIYVDPAGGAEGFRHLPDPDLILITDIHGDHLDVQTLGAIHSSHARFVVPAAVAAKLPAPYRAGAVVLPNGETTEALGIRIEAIPMYNLPVRPDAFHTKGRGNGYVLTLGGKRVYISGDTEDIPEMRALKDIDVAFVCMNLPYTMDVDQAAEAVLAFRPGIVYPYHYRGGGGRMSDVKRFKKLVGKAPAIEVRLRNWYP